MDAERDMDVAPKRVFRRPLRQIRHVLPILRPGRGNDKPPYSYLPRGGQNVRQVFAQGGIGEMTMGVGEVHRFHTNFSLTNSL